MTHSHLGDTAGVPLLLDEMYSPAIAKALRDHGHDVRAVADDPELRAMADDDLYRWAAGHGRRIVTENVKDFRRILAAAQESGMPRAALLFTSSRRFPRSRRNPGPLIDALDAWLRGPDAGHSPEEDWLPSCP